jgi:hypothetical protein
MAAYGAGWGLLLGMIYGMLYPYLQYSLNRASSSDTQLPTLDFMMVIFFGWMVGGATGCVWGLAVSLVESLVLVVVALLLRSSRVSYARHAFLLALACGTLAAAIHLTWFAFAAPSYPTFAHWLTNSGLPVLIMSITFALIAYSVGKWYVAARAIGPTITDSKLGQPEKRIEATS